MLHTKLFSPTKKLFFSEISEEGKRGEKLTLTEATKKALEERKALQDAQKEEVSNFLKSISWSNGKIRPTLTEEQQSTLNFLLKVINVQQSENETLDSKVIADKVAIIWQTQEALKSEKAVPRKITEVRNKEQIQVIQSTLEKVVVSWEKKDFSKLTPEEKTLLSELFKDLRPYLPINKDINSLVVDNERLEISYDIIRLALKGVTTPLEIPAETVSLKELLMWDPNEVLYLWKPGDVPPTPKEKVIITAIQKKLVELWLEEPFREDLLWTYYSQDFFAIQKIMVDIDSSSDPRVIRRWFVNKLLKMERLPQEQPKETTVFNIDILRKWDSKEIITRKTLKLPENTPASEVNEAQKKLIIEIQRKLIELWYLDKVPDTDLWSFGWKTENAIARFMKQNNIEWKASEITRWLAVAILDSQVSFLEEKKAQPEEKQEVKWEEGIVARKLQKWAEKVPNEEVRKVQRLLKTIDKKYQGWDDGLFGDKTEESLKRVLQNYLKEKDTDSTIITTDIITRLEKEAKRLASLREEVAPQTAPQRTQPALVRPRVLPRSRPVDISPKKQVTLPRSWVDSSSLVPEKNFFEKIFSFSEDLETSKFNDLRGKIESTISAKSGLETLEKQIFTISNSLDKGKIESVYTLAQQELWKKWIQLDSSLSPIEKAYILQLVANALMWGKSMVERREKNRTSIKEYIQADRSQTREADRLFAQTFSWTMVKDISAARNLAYQELSKIGTYKEMFLNNESGTYIFSVRSKNGMNWLQGYAGGSWEIVDIGVPYVRITEFEKRDVQKLISALNPVQLTLLRQQLKPIYWKLSDTQVISLLISGEKVWPQFVVKTPQGNITLELTFNKWGNCFNDAIWVHIELPVVVYSYDKRSNWNGWNGHGSWWQWSNPGVRGGGNGGGGNGEPGAWWSGR